MDITEHPDEDKLPRVPRTRAAFPARPSHQAEVAALKRAVDMDQTQANLVTLSSFFTRFYTSATGVQSSNWVFQQAKLYAANRTDIAVTEFAHSWPQRSVIARFAGRNPTGPTTILGAHQDSINVANVNNRSPGADDDGSGTVTILEAFRVLASTGFVPANPLEFQWYAAEEVGLLGSQAIAANYRSIGKEVYAMFQLDMTGYTTQPQAPVRVITDFVDADLTELSRQLIDAYTTLPRRDTTCGYACSDHASYYRSGYPSATTFEAVLCPRIHSEGDDLNLIVWSQVREFVYLAIGFAVELTYGN
jgi:leucyl aminopeptidase